MRLSLALVMVISVGCAGDEPTVAPAKPDSEPEPPQHVLPTPPPEQQTVDLTTESEDMAALEAAATAAFELELAEVLAAEVDADFSEAMRRCRSMRKTYSSQPRAGTLARTMGRLIEERRKSIGLPFAIGQLGSDDIEVRNVAMNKILDAGEAGRIYLRKAISQAKGPIAAEAAQMLALDEFDQKAVPLIVRRLMKDPAGAVGAQLAEVVEAIGGRIDVELLPELSVFIQSDAGQSHATMIIKVMARVIADADDDGNALLRRAGEPLIPLLAGLTDDSEHENRRSADLLMQVLSAWCDDKTELFDICLSTEKAYAKLKAYVKKAMESDVQLISQWGHTHAVEIGLEVSLVGWWRFDEDDGAVIVDASGRNNHGKLKNGPVRVPGIIGNALSFDGKDDYVALGNAKTLQVTGDQTLAMWLKPASFNARRNPFAKAYGGECTLTLEPNGTINYFYGPSGLNGGAYQGFCMTKPIPQDQWTHIAVVRDLKARKLYWYRNGLKVNEAHAQYATPAASKLEAMIGKGYVSPFHGLIDDVRLYARVLAGREIQVLFSAGKKMRVLTGSQDQDG